MEVNMEVWTVSLLAKEAGLTVQHIARLLRSGEIKGKKLTSGWIVYDEEANRFLQERQEKEASKVAE
jgi:hypothetical protein